MTHRLAPIDWEAEFRYLEMAHTVPSRDDLRNSFMDGGIDRQIATCLAELVCVVFERIGELERGVSTYPR